MRKLLICLVAFGMVAGTGSAASAGDSNYWFDVRNNAAGVQDITGTPERPYTNGQGGGFPDDGGGAGGRGDGQVLRVTPRHADGFETLIANSYPNFDGDFDTSMAQAHLFVDVSAKCAAAGAGTDVISSMGVDMVATGPATPANGYSMTWTWNTTGAFWTNPGFGFLQGASDGNTPQGWIGAKVVNGLVPGGPYLVGTLSVQGGLRECSIEAGHAANSTYEVRLVVNNLLITRVCDNEDPGDEQVSFGYTGGAPEAAVNGGTEGSTSTAADLYIEVKLKTDANGEPSCRRTHARRVF